MKNYIIKSLVLFIATTFLCYSFTDFSLMSNNKEIHETRYYYVSGMSVSMYCNSSYDLVYSTVFSITGNYTIGEVENQFNAMLDQKYPNNCFDTFFVKGGFESFEKAMVSKDNDMKDYNHKDMKIIEIEFQYYQ